MAFVLSPFAQGIIGNLSAYIYYVIKVAAVTSAGVGPESEITILTDDDGKYAISCEYDAKFVTILVFFHIGKLLELKLMHFL